MNIHATYGDDVMETFPIAGKSVKNHKARSHYAICDCYLFLLVMVCTGAGEVATVAKCEHFR